MPGRRASPGSRAGGTPGEDRVGVGAPGVEPGRARGWDCGTPEFGPGPGPGGVLAGKERAVAGMSGSGRTRGGVRGGGLEAGRGRIRRC
ncbi:MAG: hypothetical protein LBT40_06180 [Deltaproteobacteria bacterium]|nr:hypothetical protein [Deltaproteobacteria bacterium]